MNSGAETVVGVNKYVTGETQKIPVFSVDEAIGRIATERIVEYRNQRDSTRTKSALEDLRQAAIKVDQGEGGEGYLMPALIDAFRAEATLGEAMEVIKEIFGFSCEQ